VLVSSIRDCSFACGGGKEQEPEPEGNLQEDRVRLLALYKTAVLQEPKVQAV